VFYLIAGFFKRGNEESMAEGFQRIKSIAEKTLEGLTLIGFAAVIVMMVWGTLDVVMQQFGSSLPATVAWTEVLNVMAVTLPLAYATYGRAHISIDLVTTIHEEDKCDCETETYTGEG